MVRGENQSELLGHDASADPSYVREPGAGVYEHIIEARHQHIAKVGKKASVIMVEVTPVEIPYFLPVIVLADRSIGGSAASLHQEQVPISIHGRVILLQRELSSASLKDLNGAGIIGHALGKLIARGLAGVEPLHVC